MHYLKFVAVMWVWIVLLGILKWSIEAPDILGGTGVPLFNPNSNFPVCGCP